MSAHYNLNYDTKGIFSINSCVFGPYPFLFIVSGLSGTIAVLTISSFLNFNSLFIKNTVLKISNGTIVILGFHWGVYKMVFDWWMHSYSVVAALTVSMIVTIICCFLIVLSNKHFSFLLGNRKLN